MPPRDRSLLGLLSAGLVSCSLVFDTGDLDDGVGGATSTAGAGTTIGASSTTASSTGGEGGAPATSSASGPEGGGGAASATGTAGGQGGEGGAPCSGPTFCETDGADAAWCFDFDGADPLGGLAIYEPDGKDFTTAVRLVEDPTVSCPRALELQVEGTGDFPSTFLVAGGDLPAGDDVFRWSFAVHRVAIQDSTTLDPVAVLNWTSGDVDCQAFVFMRDEGDTSLVRLYTQGNDGTDWAGTGGVDIDVPHATVGQWTGVELAVDSSGPGSMTLRVDDLEESTAIDSLCGPATDHYNVDFGHFYFDRNATTAYDDVTLRLGP